MSLANRLSAVALMPVAAAMIALSGVLAQLALFVGAALAREHLPPDLAEAFIRRNGIMLLLNLVPMRPLDGAQPA